MDYLLNLLVKHNLTSDNESIEWKSTANIYHSRKYSRKFYFLKYASFKNI